MKSKLIFLCGYLILTLSANTASAQTVTFSNVTGAQVAQNYTVDMTLSGYNNMVSSFQMSVYYDSSKLTYISTGNLYPADGWVIQEPMGYGDRVTFVVTPNSSFVADTPVNACRMTFTYKGLGLGVIGCQTMPTPMHFYDDNLDEYCNIGFGCNGSANVSCIAGSIDGVTVGMQDDNQERTLIVSPNPTTGDVKIFVSECLGQFFTVCLLNSMGQIVKREVFQRDSQSSIDWNLSVCPDGIYQFVVMDKAGIVSGSAKIVILK